MGWISKVRLKLAARQLREGKLLAYPTEAVWGLGCDPLNLQAVADLLALKGRMATKGMILIAARFEQIKPLVDIESMEVRNRLMASWPGPKTWVVPAAPKTPVWMRGKLGTLAARVTSHPVASALCQALGGAIVSTSANPSGAQPARTMLKTRRYFKDAQLNFLPGAIGDLDKPTAIFDARSGMRLR